MSSQAIRRGRPVVYHGRRSVHNHWGDRPCRLAEWINSLSRSAHFFRRIGGYACPGSGVMHNSKVRLVEYRIADGDGRSVGLARLGRFAKELADEPWFQAANAEHDGAYASDDRLPYAGSSNGKPVLKLYGCSSFRQVANRLIRDRMSARGWEPRRPY